MGRRNKIFRALYDLSEKLTWGNNQKFQTRSRRLMHFDKVDANMQPAFFQTEHAETTTVTRGNPWKQVWGASWVIYLASGKDSSAIPADDVNDLIDALEALLPQDEVSGRFTLGGLVYDCYIEGETIKIPGDIDDQGMIVIPLKLLIP